MKHQSNTLVIRSAPKFEASRARTTRKITRATNKTVASLRKLKPANTLKHKIEDDLSKRLLPTGLRTAAQAYKAKGVNKPIKQVLKDMRKVRKQYNKKASSLNQNKAKMRKD